MRTGGSAGYGCCSDCFLSGLWPWDLWIYTYRECKDAENWFSGDVCLCWLVDEAEENCKRKTFSIFARLCSRILSLR